MAEEYEVKFIGPSGRTPIIEKFLKSTCRPDPQFPFGIVTSVYYDTADFRSLSEKMNSEYLKSKYRLRWYQDSHGAKNTGLHFEIKKKIGCYRKKIRMNDLSEQELISDSSLNRPLNQILDFHLRRNGISLAQPIFPLFSVSYQRYRFIEPQTGLRVSLDHSIRVPVVNLRMMPRATQVSLDTVVVEVKGNTRQLPRPLYPIVDLGLHKSSFSKYLTCFLESQRMGLSTSFR